MSISEFVGGGYGQWRMTEAKSNKVGSYSRENNYFQKNLQNQSLSKYSIE